MKLEERKKRIIARGEISDHCHVVTGNATITREGEKVIINVEDGQAYMKHLLESKWIEGVEVWTREHDDIKLEPGKYEYIQQIEFDPFEKIIRKVVD